MKAEKFMHKHHRGCDRLHNETNKFTVSCLLLKHIPTKMNSESVTWTGKWNSEYNATRHEKLKKTRHTWRLYLRQVHFKLCRSLILTNKLQQINSIQFKLSNALHLKWPAARNYHSVENACSNKNVFSLRLNTLESVISWIAYSRLL